MLNKTFDKVLQKLRCALSQKIKSPKKLFALSKYFPKRFTRLYVIRNLKMSLSRSLNFSIFQSSNSSQKKEDFEEEDDDEDYDWGKYFQNLFLSILTVAEAKTFANFLADKSCQ